MRSPRQFVLQLTPSSAFLVFAGALAFGAAGIIKGGPAWLVYGPVLVYGGMLFYAQRKLYVALNATLKDSPYFLGFILTLIGLAVLLQHSALAGADQAQASGLIQSVGEALLPTVFGLFARQALLSLDVAEMSRDAAFNKVVATIREDARVFYEQQQMLVTLIGEFTRTREEMFAVEAQAHQRYVTSLTEASTSLADLQRAWPTGLAQLGAAVTGAAGAFQASAEESARMLSEVRDAIRATAASGSTAAGAAAAEMVTALADSRIAIEREMKQTTALLSQTSTGVESEVAQLKSILHRYPKAISELADAVQGVSSATGALSGDLAALSNDACDLAKSLSGAMATSADAASAAHASILESRERAAQTLRVASEGSLSLVTQVGEQARASLADMRAVDEIVGDVVRILRQRLVALETSGASMGGNHVNPGIAPADRQEFASL